MIYRKIAKKDKNSVPHPGTSRYKDTLPIMLSRNPSKTPKNTN